MSSQLRAKYLLHLLDEEEEEDEIMMTIVGLMEIKGMRRWWVHPINKRRKQFGSFHSLVPELRLHFDRYQGYLRLDVDQFADVLQRVGPVICKKDTNMREAISAEERLTIFLRYLATGESVRSLSYSFRVGVSTVSQVIRSVASAIWDSMNDEFMSVPRTEEQWKSIASRFDQLWNFPHCIGAVDGKHVVLVQPANSGSLFYNYKGTFSLVLLSVVDADYRFIIIDVGAYGHNNDAGIFAASKFGTALREGELHLPKDTCLQDSPALGPMPYVFVGDDAFPMGMHLMKPYTRANNIDIEKKIFNYRLSRARRMVESVFGMMAARWRVFQTKIALMPETAVTVVKAACILHNYMRTTTPLQQQQELEPVDVQNCAALANLEAHHGRSQQQPCQARDTFKTYFNGEGSVPWQTAIVTKGSHPCD